LVIHGTEDSKVSFYNTEQFVINNLEKKPDLEYYWLDGVWHSMRGSNRDLDLRDSLIFDFLDRKLN
jgi:dipeptidyl aminopeptidase/acylaminoacyl peptidase